MRLPDVPFLEQDDFNRVLAALRNGDLLFFSTTLAMFPVDSRSMAAAGLSTVAGGAQRARSCGLQDRWLEGVQTQLPEDGDVVGRQRTDHQDTRTNSIFTEGVVQLDHGLTTVCRHGQGEGLTDEVAVPVIVRVNHDHTVHRSFLVGGRDDHLFAVLCVPADVNQSSLRVTRSTSASAMVVPSTGS